MVKIYVVGRISDNFGSAFQELFKLMEQINGLLAQKTEQICLDLSKCVFLNPFFLLPLFLLREQYKGKVDIIFELGDSQTLMNQYLKYIGFEAGGIKPNNENYLVNFENKTYIPIICFPATRYSNEAQIRDVFLSSVTNLLRKQLSLKGRLLSAIMYLIDEMINNIVDHSGIQDGFLFCQFYKDKHFLDLCLIDNGVGLLANYQQYDFLPSDSSHSEAIDLAINGKSTKDRQEGSRGFGITTSKQMLVKGLGGKYLLYSGNSYYCLSKKVSYKKKLLSL